MSNPANAVPTTAESLLRVIKLIESSNNMGAIRFERKVFNRITDAGYTPALSNIQKANHCSSDTARAIYSMSWGAYQIMGFNLYGDLKLSIPIFDYLKDYCMQDELAWAFINDVKKIGYSVDELKNDEIKRNHFAVTYNGSSNYAINIMKAIKELGL